MKAFSYKKIAKELFLKTSKKFCKYSLKYTVKKYTTFQRPQTPLSSEKRQYEYSINTKRNKKKGNIKICYKLNKEFSTDGVTLSVEARPLQFFDE